MRNIVIDKQSAKHYTWGDNCDSWVLADTEGLSVKEESMPAGTKEKLHYHTHARQYFYILEGSATFYLDNEQVIVTERRGLFIQPKTRHFIANETPERLEFLVISQPTTNNDRTTMEKDS